MCLDNSRKHNVQENIKRSVKGSNTEIGGPSSGTGMFKAIVLK